MQASNGNILAPIVLCMLEILNLTRSIQAKSKKQKCHFRGKKEAFTFTFTFTFINLRIHILTKEYLRDKNIPQ